jgi:hypothetical protein
MAHYTESPEHISWPSPPDPRPRSGVVGSHRAQQPPFLSWRRPPSSKVDPARRLLATGRYADQEDAAQAAWKAAATAAAAAAAAASGPREILTSLAVLPNLPTMPLEAAALAVACDDHGRHSRARSQNGSSRRMMEMLLVRPMSRQRSVWQRA